MPTISESKVIVLVSYAGVEDSSYMAMDIGGIRRIYALVRLSHLGEAFKVDSVKSVPYQSVRSLEQQTPPAPHILYRPQPPVPLCTHGYSSF